MPFKLRRVPDSEKEKLAAAENQRELEEANRAAEEAMLQDSEQMEALEQREELEAGEEETLIARLLSGELDPVPEERSQQQPEEEQDTTTFAGAFLDGFLFRNPSLVDFIGLTPIIAAGFSVQNGLILSFATIVTMTIVTVVASLLSGKLPRRFAAPLYTVLASVIVLPIQYVGENFLGESAYYVFQSLSLLLPLIAVNGLTLSRVYQFALSHRVLPTLGDALGKSIGFSAVLLAISSLREILGFGTFFGLHVPIFSQWHWRILTTPAGGFLIMALVAAAIQFLQQRRRIRKKGGEAQ